MDNPLETPKKRDSSKIFTLINTNHKNSSYKSGTTKASTYIGPYIYNQKNGKRKLIVILKMIKTMDLDKKKFRWKYIYIGEFKDYQKHGQGTLILDGIKTWSYKVNLKMVKYQAMVDLEEKEYIGEWDKNELSGYGILTNKTTKHIDYFSHNNIQGYWANFFNTQFTILGNRENDLIEGYAIIIVLNDLDHSNNIISTNNEYNYNNGDLEHNYKIVKTYKREIVHNNIENDESNK